MGKQVAARLNGGVAQLGEHLPCKQGVKSSNLSVSIRDDKSRTLYLENFIQKDFDELNLSRHPRNKPNDCKQSNVL